MEIFQKYVSKFDMNDEMILLKYKHSLRVASLTKLIAKNLKMDDKAIDLAYLCGLYHDIGRFMQVKKYHSFDDLNTIDHGDLGYKIFLNEIAIKKDLSPRDESTIAKAIMYHNKLKVPSKLTDNQKEYVWITRDADKIDILYQMAPINGLMPLDDNEVSKEVHEQFVKYEPIDHRIVQNATDKNLLILAFIFDLKYKESLKIIKDNKFLEKLQKRLSAQKYEVYFKILNDYIKERFKC